MNNWCRAWARRAIALLFLFPTAVIPAPACQPGAVAFLYLNGVFTTKEDADKALEEMASAIGSETSQNEPIQYEVLYNHTHGFEDFIEVFGQRMAEHAQALSSRFELFFQVLKGDGPYVRRLREASAAWDEVDRAMGDYLKSAIPGALSSARAEAESDLTYAEHRSRIDVLALEGKKLLLFAHSQGNLFANRAYEHAVRKVTAKSVHLVHVAPASPRLSGQDHTLADLDLVIDALRPTGTIAAVTDAIPPFASREPGLNDRRDILGHGLLEIYLNPTLGTAARIHTLVRAAYATMVAPTATAKEGLFSVSVTWDRPGDVDLHVTEPAGKHIYFADRDGAAGRLDLDDRHLGPEHYVARCEPGAVQPGVYRVELANFANATGRRATVQLASWADGVIDTQAVELGEPTGRTPSRRVFDVEVRLDDAAKVVISTRRSG